MTQQGRRERAATSVLFFVNGAVVGCWVPFIPERAQALSLTAGRLGTVLLGGGLGAVIAMPLAGHLILRWGSRFLSTLCGIGFALMLFLNILMPDQWSLLVSLISFGIFGASMDIAMNAQAVLVEARQNKRILSSLHGLYSLGNVVGSFGISAAFARSLPPRLTCAAVTFLLCLAIVGSGRQLLEDGHRNATTPAQKIFVPRLILLGLLVVAAMVCEGGTADWSGLYLRNGRGLGPGWAGVGFGVFSTIMLLGRLAGDTVVTRVGEVRTLRFGGLIAAGGACLIVFAPGAALPLLGFGVFGAGLANASPVLYRAAGRMPNLPAGVGLATSVGMGYAGLLAGPPLLGGIGQAYGLRVIFLVLAALAFLLCAGAGMSRSPIPSAPGSEDTA